MLLIQRDDIVEHLSAATSDPPLRNSVLRGDLNARPLRLQSGRSQQIHDFVVEFRVVVKEHIAVRVRFSCFGAERRSTPS